VVIYSQTTHHTELRFSALLVYTSGGLRSDVLVKTPSPVSLLSGFG
jgi:hypothetical protein